MRWKKTASMVEVHAEGEIGRVVTSGVLDVPGATMLDKMVHLNEVDDRLRRFFCFEPRGSAQMSTNLLFAPTRPDADAAFLILQPDRAHAMSGSNCICVVTALLETGLVEMREPETVLHLDTPAGLVRAVARCRDGACESVSLDMPASFAERLDASVEVEGLGTVRLDIAFGGVFYALVDPAQFGQAVVPERARELADLATRIHQAVDRQLSIAHPTLPGISGISYVMFTDHDAEGVARGGTVLPPGRFDRSPCGTGNAARLAVRAARGEARPGERFAARSIIGSRFEVEYVGDTEVAGRPAILPRITGRGWIYGMHQIGLDPSDPFADGYAVSDCWGPGLSALR